MTVYYPQAVVTLRITWENFGDENNFFLSQVYTLQAVPKRVTVSINDYMKADTVTLDMDYKNFPFDPRCIRACGITVHIQDMKKAFDEQGPVQIKPVEETFASTNAVFVGFADTDAITFSDSERSVKFEGRDYTGLLIDTPMIQSKPFSQTLPLDVILYQLLQSLPATKNIIIDVRGLTRPLLTYATLAPDKSVMATERSHKRGETYWELIQSMVSQAGLIAFIELDKLVVTKPRELYPNQKLKQFVWGTNLSSLDFKRKLGRQKNFNIIVRSFQIGNKAPIEAKIPLEATAEFAQKTGIPQKEVTIPQIGPKGEDLPPKPANYMAFRLADVSTKEHLVTVGEKIYEEISRQELEGSLQTKDMLVLENNPNAGPVPSRTPVEFDITKIRIGTPIELRIEQDDLEAIKRESDKAKKYQYLLERGYAQRVAEAFSQVMGNVSTPFYTKAVEYTLDAESGFSVKLEFINFITISKGLLNP